MARKYARIFVRGHYLFLVAHSFPRATLSKNCSLLGTDNVRQMATIVYIYRKKYSIRSNWLRAVQFKCNTSARVLRLSKSHIVILNYDWLKDNRKFSKPMISHETLKIMCGKFSEWEKMASRKIFRHEFSCLYFIFFSFNLEWICTCEYFKKLKFNEPLHDSASAIFFWRNCRKIFLEAIFLSFEKTFFQVFAQNFIILRDIIGLENFLLTLNQL